MEMLKCLMATEISMIYLFQVENDIINIFILDGEFWIFKSDSMEPFYRTCAYAGYLNTQNCKIT